MKILLQHRVEDDQLKRLEDIIGDEHTYVAPSSRDEIAEEGKDTSGSVVRTSSHSYQI